MAKKKETTSHPTSVKLKRNGDKFICSWNNKEKYNKIQVEFWYKWGKKKTTNTYNLAGGRSKKVVDLNFGDKTNLSTVHCHVKGIGKDTSKVDKTWSKWEDDSFVINAPDKPTVSTTLMTANKSSFTWSGTYDAKDHKPFAKFERQTKWIENCAASTEKEFNDLSGWTDLTNIATGGTVEYTEDTTEIASSSHTRAFRVRAYGAGGHSAWVVAWHVYAQPLAATDVHAFARKDEASNTFALTASWQGKSTSAHPIDDGGVVPQYLKTVPEAGMTAPDDGWVDLPAQTVNQGTNKYNGALNGLLGAEQVLFFRVLHKHDSHEVASIPTIATGDGISPLRTPSKPTFTSSGNTVAVTTGYDGQVEDAFVVVWLEDKNGKKQFLGRMENSTTSFTVAGLQNKKPINIGAKAVVATWDNTKTGDAKLSKVMMESPEIWGDAVVPIAPSSLRLSSTNRPNTVRAEWDWSWEDADKAEISWSTEPDAWESTDEPDTHEVTWDAGNVLNIKDVEAGVPLYVRVRLSMTTDEETILSPYSEQAVITISSVPAVPKLVLSDTVVDRSKSIKCSWVYITTDGSEQEAAEVDELTVVNNQPVYTKLADVGTEQSVTISCSRWAQNTKHRLVVKVKSESGRYSEWSAPVDIDIAPELTCSITTTVIQPNQTIETLDGEAWGETVNILPALPFTVRVTGAGSKGDTSLALVRAEGYHKDRPDGDDYLGFEGEVVYQSSYKGDGVQTIDADDLEGHLDDFCMYNIRATIRDSLGRSKTSEYPFLVRWNEQALIPEATAQIDGTIAKIRPTATGARETDYCEIWRLSADKPELVVEHGTFGTTYVDPYPSIGTYGYRVVSYTKNGDFIANTEDGGEEYAWYDVETEFNTPYTIIDFGGNQLNLSRNVDVSNSWTKDFQQTKYLGGAVHGDWNVGVLRSGSISTVAITVTDMEQIDMLKSLATYVGDCHVRTQDGSSYTADVQVAEDIPHDKRGLVRSYTLTITRIDGSEYDGMTLAEWNELQEES